MSRIKRIASVVMVLAFLCNTFLLDTGFAQSDLNFNKNSSTLVAALNTDDMLGVERQAVREIAMIFYGLKKCMLSADLEITPDTLIDPKGVDPRVIRGIDRLETMQILRHEATEDTPGIVAIRVKKDGREYIIEYDKNTGNTLIYPFGKRPVTGIQSAVVAADDLYVLNKVLQQDTIEMIYKAGSGHPGGSLSMLNMVTALYFSGLMRIDPNDPNWVNRDRLVLSKGHAAPGLYAALGRRGYFSVEEFNTLRKLGSRLQGHTDMTKTPGVDMSAGSLGVGISAAVGMAIAAKMDDRDYMTYVMLGDGETQEGQVSEAARQAAAMGLDNLIAFLDWNGMQIDGKVTEVDLDYEGQLRLWEARGWNVIRADGSDMADILRAIAMAKSMKNGKPVIIIAKTIKGAGLQGMAAHGSAPKEADVKSAIDTINTAIAAVKGDGFNAARHIQYVVGRVSLSKKDKAAVDEENNRRTYERERKLLEVIQSEKADEAKRELEKAYDADKKIATRTSTGDELALLGLQDLDVIGTTADLNGSVMFVKFAEAVGTFSGTNPLGRYIPAGISEASMFSMKAGLASCGKIPFSGTFSVFTTRMVDQINAVLNTDLPAIIVGTHGGLATGPDGRTHQDAHSLGVLGALPRVKLYEGADAVEARVLLRYIYDTVRKEGGIHYIRPARLNTLILAKPEGWQEGAKKGFYVLYDSEAGKAPAAGKYDVVIVSSGVMAVDTVAAAKELAASGQKVKVVNVTQLKEISNDKNVKEFGSLIAGCTKLISVIDALPETLGSRINEVLVKEHIMPASLRALGIQEFGESGAPAELYKKHGFDKDGIVRAAKEMPSQSDLDERAAIEASPIRKIQNIGQQIWLDGLTWEMIQNGEFEKLVRIHGITGVTTNPSLIKAYLKSDAVKAKIAILARQGKTRDEIYFEVIKELAQAVIVAFDKCGVNGKFSIELNPNKADDLDASIEEAKMWSGIDPEHIMIKVAATHAGYKIAEELTANGINVNATLIFTDRQYEYIVNAYIAGLERALAQGKDIRKIYSVASFFVSRWDVKLGNVIPAKLHGKLANSISIIAYNEVFRKLFTSERFSVLQAKGAGVQDFLVASTGSKRSKMPPESQDRYPDDIYVKDIMGPQVVNTLPLETIESMIKNGIDVAPTIIEKYEEAKDVVKSMPTEVDLDDVGEELFEEGKAAFVKDFNDVMKTIEDIISAGKAAAETSAKDKSVPVQEVMSINLALDTAAVMGAHIPTAANTRFNLLVTSEFFANGELKEHRERYGDRFNIDAVSGSDADQFVKNVLGNALAVKDKAIVLLPNELANGRFEDRHYKALTDAGIRFLMVDRGDLLKSREEKDENRSNFQQDTYAVMLLMRAIDGKMDRSSPIYRLLSFYLSTHFNFTDKIAVDDYIMSITKGDIMTLIKGILMYRPAKAYDRPDYKNVAATLMAA